MFETMMVENEPDVEVIVRTLKQLALFLLVRLRDRASSSFAGLSLPVRYLTACKQDCQIRTRSFL